MTAPAAELPAADPARRRPTRDQRYKYVRRVKGRKFQARIPIGGRGGGAVNLGLYDSEWSAWRAVKEVGRYPIREATPLGLWEAVRAAQRAGHVPGNVLPKYAFRLPCGGYGARVRLSGERIALGPYPSPEDATAAMLRLLAERKAARKLAAAV